MKKLIPICLLILVIMTGCAEGGNGSLNQTGSISLTIASPDFMVKTIQPNIDMTIATYDVYGTGPSGTNFRKNAVIGNNVTINALVTGDWTITVDAKNKDGIIIASGLSSVTVVNGQTITANVTVRPLSGTGVLKLGLSWPSGTISHPVIAATLTPKGGSASTINFNLGSDNFSATYQNTAINAGYYTLLVYLYDGTSFKWGAAEAVRILAGQTSEGNYPIIPGTGFGGINLIITPDLQNPIGITFSGQQDQLLIGSGMTITAATSEPVETYQWYLNGWPLSGETNPSITIGSSLGQGAYRLDLIVTKGTITSSETVNFRISQFVKNQKITLNFDTMNTSESGSCPLSNEFQAYGVIFSSFNPGTNEINSTAVYKDSYGGCGATSLPNAVGFGYRGSITRIVFMDPVTGNPGVTNFVSAMVGDRSSESDPITMTAYDINHQVLGTCSFTSQPTNTLGVNDFGLVSLSKEGIHQVEFTDASPSSADFDDLTFTIPESL